MKTIIKTALALASVVFLFSCYKIDFGDLLRDRDKVKTPCKIKTLKYAYYSNYADSPVVTEFRYNKWGDPDSIISSLSITGHPGLYLFYYDSHHRLTEYMGLYRSSEGSDRYHAYHVWSKYNYDHQGRIVWDSSYSMGGYIDGHPVPPYNTQLMARLEYFYDQQNRIIKLTSHWGGNLFVYDYKYTPQGNLDGGTYDNKVNIYQVNKIWQVLAKDYSINNPLSRGYSPLAYNKYGLPVSYSGRFRWLDLYGDNMQVEYDCK